MEIKELQIATQWSYRVWCYVHFISVPFPPNFQVHPSSFCWVFGAALMIQDLVKVSCALMTTILAPYGVWCQQWMTFHEPIYLCYSVWVHKPMWSLHYWFHLLILLLHASLSIICEEFLLFSLEYFFVLAIIMISCGT